MRKWVKGDKSIEEAYARKTARDLEKRGIVIEPALQPLVIDGDTGEVEKPKKKSNIIKKLVKPVKKKEKKHGRRTNR
jgi:hypothetical protein